MTSKHSNSDTNTRRWVVGRRWIPCTRCKGFGLEPHELGGLLYTDVSCRQCSGETWIPIPPRASEPEPDRGR